MNAFENSFVCTLCSSTMIFGVKPCQVWGAVNPRCSCVCYRHCVTDKKVMLVCLYNPTCEVHGSKEVKKTD